MSECDTAKDASLCYCAHFISCCAVLCCAEAHNNLGVLQRDVGAIPDALSSYERALQLVPDSRNAGRMCWAAA